MFLALGGGIAVMIFVGQRARSWARARADYLFDPARAELLARKPDWLRPEMARPLLRQYLQMAGEPFSLLDDGAFGAWLARLRSLPWVADVEAEPRLPDRVALRLALRRPVAATRDRAGRLWLFGADGMRLPSEEPVAADGGPVFGLPWLRNGPGRVASGGAWADGAAIVAEFERELRPRVRALLGGLAYVPRLLAVDLRDAGLPVSPEFRVLVAAADGVEVELGWGHAPGATFEVIATEQKARILAMILSEHPGLRGVAAADVRFENTWRDRIRPVSTVSEGAASR